MTYSTPCGEVFTTVDSGTHSDKVFAANFCPRRLQRDASNVIDILVGRELEAAKRVNEFKKQKMRHTHPLLSTCLVK